MSKGSDGVGWPKEEMIMNKEESDPQTGCSCYEEMKYTICSQCSIHGPALIRR